MITEADINVAKVDLAELCSESENGGATIIITEEDINVLKVDVKELCSESEDEAVAAVVTRLELDVLEVNAENVTRIKDKDPNQRSNEGLNPTNPYPTIAGRRMTATGSTAHPGLRTRGKGIGAES